MKVKFSSYFKSSSSRGGTDVKAELALDERVHFRFRQRLLGAVVLVGELCLNELSLNLEGLVQNLFQHVEEGKVSSCRVHPKARRDLWSMNRSRWLLTFTSEHSVGSLRDWNLP